MEKTDNRNYISPEIISVEAVAEKGFATSGEERMGVDAPDYINGFDF